MTVPPVLSPAQPVSIARSRGARPAWLVTLAMAARLLLAGLAGSLPAQAAENHDNSGIHRGFAASITDDLAYPADFSHFDYANPDAPKGGTLKIGAIGGFDSLNPFILKGTAAGISGLLNTGFLYMALTESGEDDVFAQYGGLASRIDYPEDRSWVAFELNPAARWSDGEPITAEDVVWSFDALRTVGHPLYASYYADVDKVEAENLHRVKFSFKRAGNKELPLIVGQLPVLPKHWWTAKGRNIAEPTLEPPVGSGPYRVVRVDNPRSISLERVKNWWAKDLPAFKGMYNYDRIDIEYFRDAGVMLEAFKGGELDYRIENSARNWAEAYDTPAVKHGDIIKEQIKHDLPLGMQAFTFNLRRAKFQDPRVRRALIELFDFEWMNRTIFYDSYTRTDSYFENSELAGTEPPTPDELAILKPLREKYPDFVPAAVLTDRYTLPVSDGSGRDRRMTRKALGLLKQAGYVLKDGKMIDGRTGEQLTIEMLLGSPLMERIVLAYGQTLEKIGIRLTVRSVDAATYQRLVDDFDFDMISAVFGQSLSPGNEQLEFWGSQAADIKGSRNLAGIKNPAIDALIQQVITAPDRPALITRTRALDRVLLFNDYNIPAWHLPAFRIAYWNRFGHPARMGKYGSPDIARSWWIDPARDAALADTLKR